MFVYMFNYLAVLYELNVYKTALTYTKLVPLSFPFTNLCN